MTTHRGQCQLGRPGDHRCTPEVIWRAALDAAGLECWDLDPASNRHSTIPASLSLTGTRGDDGLVDGWGHRHVWLNPPFSSILPWVEKASREAHVSSLTVLAPVDPSVRWHRALVRLVDAIAEWPRREHFPVPGQPKGSPPGAVALYYTGPRSNRWMRIMRDCYGCTVRPGVIDGPQLGLEVAV